MAGPTSNCWSPGPIVSDTWPSWSTKSTGSTNSIPLARPSASISLGLLDAIAGDEVGLVVVGRIFGHAQVELLAVQLGGGLLQRHGQRAGGDHQANLAAVDHRLQVVELVGLQAAEDRPVAAPGNRRAWPSNCSASYSPRATLVHGRRHDHARGIEAAGRKRLVDVDLGHLLRRTRWPAWPGGRPACGSRPAWPSTARARCRTSACFPA